MVETPYFINSINFIGALVSTNDKKHVVTISFPKSNLRDIKWPNPYLMIRGPQINLGEHCCTLELVK